MFKVSKQPQFFLRYRMISSKLFAAQQRTQLKNKQLIESISSTLGIKDLQEWYSIDLKVLENWKLKVMLDNYFNGSLLEALRYVYPHHHFHEWKFKNFYVPQN